MFCMCRCTCVVFKHSIIGQRLFFPFFLGIIARRVFGSCVGHFFTSFLPSSVFLVWLFVIQQYFFLFSIMNNSQTSVQPAHQPTSPPAHQPTSPPNNQPTSPPNNQPTKQPNNQPTKQPNNQTTRQPDNQTTLDKLNLELENIKDDMLSLCQNSTSDYLDSAMAKLFELAKKKEEIEEQIKEQKLKSTPQTGGKGRKKTKRNRHKKRKPKQSRRRISHNSKYHY